MKTYTIIKDRAKRANISLSQLCKGIGISRDTLEKWKKREPNTLVILEKLNAALSNAEEQNYTKMIDNTLKKSK